MKTLKFAAFVALCAAGAGVSRADTLTLASYGSTASAPAGVSNSATLFNGGTSYNVPTGGIWANPIGVSSWVSNSPGDYPGGGAYVPNGGSYVYTSTFNATSTSTGTISVMADDSVTVFLNGVLIASAAAPNPAANCTVGTPNCTSPATYTLTGFVNGSNSLRFVVDQDFDNAMGIDYAATVNTAATPEPGSLMLLGTGLLGLGTKLYRRRTA